MRFSLASLLAMGWSPSQVSQYSIESLPRLIGYDVLVLDTCDDPDKYAAAAADPPYLKAPKSRLPACFQIASVGVANLRR
ncbi:hypothetical protein CWI75_16505 [Kineobactrum sediminis]|uniref:Uncharacterized protein n=1 Tax=Kineobactrum sediminis TaxID=1905677 RepID=A0A2N5XYL5_9GAMM|nr:hypothetical protein CWI75_16505 [Kineobactrum sediminis]